MKNKINNMKKNKNNELKNNPNGYYEYRDYTTDKLPASINCGRLVYNALHWHKHIEIIANIAGQCIIEVDQFTYTLRPNEIIIINPSQRHSIQCDSSDGLQIICAFRRDILSKDENNFYENIIDDSIDSQRILNAICNLAHLQIIDPDVLQEMIFNYDNSDLYSNNAYQKYINSLDDEFFALCNMYTYDILSVLSRHKIVPTPTCASQKSNRLEACLEYINNNYTNLISIENIANHINASPSTVYRIFKHNLNVSINDYINYIRIRAVCGYLEKSDLSISDIAFSCGFTSLSNFYHVFQKIIGTSPKEYRADHTHIFKHNQLYVSEQPILSFNQFISFLELGYDKDIFLNDIHPLL